MTSSILSKIITTNGNHLGLPLQYNLTSNTTLVAISEKSFPEKLILTSTSNFSLNLPLIINEVGSLVSNSVTLGYEITIINNGVNSITINNSVSSLIVTLAPSNAAIVRTLSTPNSWSFSSLGQSGGSFTPITENLTLNNVEQSLNPNAIISTLNVNGTQQIESPSNIWGYNETNYGIAVDENTDDIYTLTLNPSTPTTLQVRKTTSTGTAIWTSTVTISSGSLSSRGKIVYSLNQNGIYFIVNANSSGPNTMSFRDTSGTVIRTLGLNNNFGAITFYDTNGVPQYVAGLGGVLNAQFYDIDINDDDNFVYSTGSFDNLGTFINNNLTNIVLLGIDRMLVSVLSGVLNTSKYIYIETTFNFAGSPPNIVYWNYNVKQFLLSFATSLFPVNLINSDNNLMATLNGVAPGVINNSSLIISFFASIPSVPNFDITYNWSTVNYVQGGFVCNITNMSVFESILTIAGNYTGTDLVLVSSSNYNNDVNGFRVPFISIAATAVTNNAFIYLMDENGVIMNNTAGTPSFPTNRLFFLTTIGNCLCSSLLINRNGIFFVIRSINTFTFTNYATNTNNVINIVNSSGNFECTLFRIGYNMATTFTQLNTGNVNNLYLNSNKNEQTDNTLYLSGVYINFTAEIYNTNNVLVFSRPWTGPNFNSFYLRFPLLGISQAYLPNPTTPTKKIIELRNDYFYNVVTLRLESNIENFLNAYANNNRINRYKYISFSNKILTNNANNGCFIELLYNGTNWNIYNKNNMTNDFDTLFDSNLRNLPTSINFI